VHDQVGDMRQHFVMVSGERRSHLEISHWLMIINLTNQPAAVVPIGRTSAVRVSQLVSEVLGGYEVPPGFEG
jgi:hypothetical protein